MRSRLHAQLTITVTRPDEIRFRVNPRGLREAREVSGLSLVQLARLCGWSRSYQAKLESGRVLTIGQEARELLIGLLRHHGARSPDARWEIQRVDGEWPEMELHKDLVDHSRKFEGR